MLESIANRTIWILAAGVSTAWIGSAPADTTISSIDAVAALYEKTSLPRIVQQGYECPLYSNPHGFAWKYYCDKENIIENVRVVSISSYSVGKPVLGNSFPHVDAKQFEIPNCLQSPFHFKRDLDFDSRTAIVSQMQTVLERSSSYSFEFSLETEISFSGVKLGSTDRENKTSSARLSLTSDSSETRETSVKLSQPFELDVPPKTLLQVTYSDETKNLAFPIDLVAVLDGDVSVVEYRRVSREERQEYHRFSTVPLSSLYPNPDTRSVSLKAQVIYLGSDEHLRIAPNERPLRPEECVLR